MAGREKNTVGKEKEKRIERKWERDRWLWYGGGGVIEREEKVMWSGWL